MPNQIPLDPKLPARFDDTPNEERSKAQLDAWWDHPYGITMPNGHIEVRCLNGGAWDRSTGLGVAANYDEACSLAEEKQAGWLRFREQASVMIDDESDKPILVVRLPQRPDREHTVLGRFATSREATEFMEGAGVFDPVKKPKEGTGK